MRKLYLIAGHGAGDPGAIGNGFEEAERVRTLCARIKALGGENVVYLDPTKNWYKTNGIGMLSVEDNASLMECHMDSGASSARGGHVIIYGGYEPDEYDIALADMMGDIFPGRSQKIVKRTDLANPKRAAQRGINYRLCEFGFITNQDDIATFNNNLTEIATRILEIFGINEEMHVDVFEKGTKEEEPKADVIEDIAKRVLRGEFGNGEQRRNIITAMGLDYDKVQAKVNEMLSGAMPKPVEPTEKDLEAVARAVIRGEYGNGAERKRRLVQAGYDYKEIQEIVNKLL